MIFVHTDQLRENERRGYLINLIIRLIWFTLSNQIYDYMFALVHANQLKVGGGELLFHYQIIIKLNARDMLY